jgi:hypothetical protein
MKTYGEWRYSSTSRDLGTRGGERLASRPGRFTPEERAPCTHYTGGLVGPRVGLDAVEKKKNCAMPVIEPSPSLYRLSYSDSAVNLIFIFRVPQKNDL